MNLLPAGVKALTILQPWASLIAGGAKDVENRSWATAYRGPLLIHAGKRLDPAGLVRAAEAGLSIDHLPAGAYVALCQLEDIVTDSDSPWAIPGQHNWVLGGVVRLRDPIPARGAQKLWSPDGVDLAKIAREVGQVAPGARAVSPG